MSNKYGHRPYNWFEAIVNKLGGEEKAEAFLRGDLKVVEPTRIWREQDDVIYFDVTSDGTTGPEWINRLMKNDFRISSQGEQLLCSSEFKSTKSITYHIAVFKSMLFKDEERCTKKIREEAKSRKLGTPNAEIACLIRESFTDGEVKAMGLSNILVMHEPIKNSGDWYLFNVDCGSGGRWLDTFQDHSVENNSDNQWNRGDGFAFVVSQK
ncbi:MAG: hypothetical protein PHE59_04770 [Patescibacteria group bacterium]|nr:hypothetical protein [Patescibacteria group bacterium]MDD5164223.1 hypothetical protein [Patescibacteria group bacterium]MDD5534641.1 hypothetical protein [Patescibacteria group bacterium]